MAESKEAPDRDVAARARGALRVPGFATIRDLYSYIRSGSRNGDWENKICGTCMLEH